MIELKIIEPQQVPYFKDGEFACWINEYEFNDLRLQIKREKAEGYAIMFDDVMIPIEPDGRLYYWPKGLFDLFITQMDELCSY